MLELRSQNVIELYVEQIRKEGIHLFTDFSISRLLTFKNEKLGELKSGKHNDLEDMVYRMQKTYDEILDILDLKHIPSKRLS